MAEDHVSFGFEGEWDMARRREMALRSTLFNSVLEGDDEVRRVAMVVGNNTAFVVAVEASGIYVVDSHSRHPHTAVPVPHDVGAAVVVRLDSVDAWLAYVSSVCFNHPVHVLGVTRATQ